MKAAARRVVFAFLAASAMVAGAAGDPPPAASPLPAAAQRLPPAVARLLNRPQAQAIEVRLATAADVQSALLEDTIALTALRDGKPQEEVRAALTPQPGSDAQRDLVRSAEMHIALYSPTQHAVLVQPDRVATLLAAAAAAKASVEGKKMAAPVTDLPPSQRDQVVALAIAHELVHAQQDQELGFIKYLGAADPQTARIRSGLTEAQAIVVQDLVAEDMAQSEGGWISAAQRLGSVMLAERYPSGATESEDLYLGNLAFAGGLKYMKDVVKSKGIEGTWETLKDPPKTLAAFAPGYPSFNQARSEALGAAVKSSLGPLLGQATFTEQAGHPSLLLGQQMAMRGKDERAALLASARECALVSAHLGELRVVAAVVVAADPSAAKLWMQEMGNDYDLYMRRMRLAGVTMEVPDPTDDTVERTVRSGVGDSPAFGYLGISRKGNAVAMVTLLRGDEKSDGMSVGDKVLDAAMAAAQMHAQPK